MQLSGYLQRFDKNQLQSFTSGLGARIVLLAIVAILCKLYEWGDAPLVYNQRAISGLPTGSITNGGDQVGERPRRIPLLVIRAIACQSHEWSDTICLCYCHAPVRQHHTPVF